MRSFSRVFSILYLVFSVTVYAGYSILYTLPMRLLIVTQAIDLDDPILGFFSGWVTEFQKHCSVSVIAQRVGRHTLSAPVFSLKKNTGASIPSQIVRFVGFLFRHWKNYDAILVHMTPVWVLFAWPLCSICRKPLYLWYEARGQSVWLRIALRVVRRVFSASTWGMPLQTQRSVIVGHGIDCAAWVLPRTDVDPYHLCTVGRITRSKRLEILLEALALLPQNYHLTFVGAPITTEDRHYEQELQVLIERLHLQNRVHSETIAHARLPEFLAHVGAFVHASTSGLDKALLEAMAAGCPAISCGIARGVLPERCQATDSATLVERVRAITALSSDAREMLSQELRSIIEREHGIAQLITRLCAEMRTA